MPAWPGRKKRTQSAQVQNVPAGAGTLTSLRRIIYTLSFTAKTYLYGPISTSAIIKKVSADMYTNTQDKNPFRSERVTVEPNPTSADRDDSYTYTTTLEFFDDAKNYDEATGDDK